MRRESRSGLAVVALGLALVLAACGSPPPESDGDVRTGTVSQGLTAVKVPQAVAAGAYHSLFLKKDGSVWAWGQNVAGQLGTGSTSSTPQPQPSQVGGLPAIKAVAAGVAHSLALDVDGNVWAWGQNASGQTGTGTAGGTVLVPTKVAALSSIQAIAANGSFSLALGVDGRLWAWGQNSSGQVGTGGTSASVATPGVVQGLPPVRAVAAGVNHALALTTDGKVWGWGMNTSGQAGTGATSTAVLAPVQVAGLPLARAVAAGAGHSLIVDEQFGNVWAWGQNTFGQVGTGSTSTTPVVTPRPVDGIFAVTVLVAGHNSSMAIIGNGLAVAWGHNVSGQLGNSGTVNSASPVGVTGLTDATALAAGAQHALALRPGCPVWAWGNNSQGQLGTGTTSTAPVTSPGTALISNTFYFDGDMDGFGDEYIFEQSCDPSAGFVEDLDCDDYTPTTHPGAAEVCNGLDDNCDGVVDEGPSTGGETCETGLQGVCAAGVMACTPDGVVCQPRTTASAEQCDNLDNDCDGQVDEGNPGGLQACATGQLGVCGEGVTYCANGAIACVPTQGASSEVCDGKDNDCDGQVDEGLLQTWYRDQDADSYGLSSQSVQACARPTGYVANAGDCDDANPAANPGAPEVLDGQDNDCDGQVDEGLAVQTLQKLAGGHNNFSVFLKSDGTVWTAGINLMGELGDGTTTDRRIPAQVQGLTGVVAITAGGHHVLALKQDGTVWAWGYNAWGQIGDGTGGPGKNRLTPVQLTSLTGVTAISAGDNHTLALKQDGTVWAWGNNSYGQVGDGTKTLRYSPVRVPGLTGVTAIVAGGYYSLAMKQDGTVWAWGHNANGQLGDGTTTERLGPVRVPGLANVAALTTGYLHTYALKQDGTVWAWGSNQLGQLGDGTQTTRLSPVQVPGLTNVVSVGGGYSHSTALKSDGTVWAWGGNTSGQLGVGGTSTTKLLTPAQVPGLTGVTAFASGWHHVLALKQDGTLWSWGENGYGGLADGTVTDRYTPVQALSF
ncbi:MopE-related protein [Corallococcus exercitus]|uniref:RCC1 repeat-containing protein n=1 Tax=Corallococcus exercitus TaxID=2316736 RepID=A0A7Y4JZQ2_9BACT|nr:MopE-related protein [Corallococcus exercitus]NOK13758.1 RCC1 repeat-containing protein [Corallococcus exercitus]